MNKIHLLLAACLAASVPALANDFSCIGESESYIKEMDIGLLRHTIDARLAKGDSLTANDHCVVAELMKRTGDTRASDQYEAAIAKDPTAAGYELFYAQYLRWTLGAMYPVWHEAKDHYNRALEKVAKYKEKGELQHYQMVIEDWATRGLIYLHESDGMVLSGSPEKTPSHYDLGYAMLNCFNYGESECGEGDLDKQKVDAVRDYAGEHMFARSLWRAGPVGFDLNGVQKQLLRRKVFKETKHRLRLRTPVATLDAWYAYKHGDNALIHNYYFPRALTAGKVDSNGNAVANPTAFSTDPFAPVTVHEYAASLTRPLNFNPLAEILLTGTVRYIERRGTVEFFGQEAAAGASVPKTGYGGIGFFGKGYPDDGVAVERMNQYELGLDWSRFLGPDKIYNENFALFQDISDWKFQQEGINLDRKRYILASKLDYAFYRPISFPWGRMYTRGWHFRVGGFMDKEFWGSSYGLKQDLYVGTELRGIGGWDVNLQSTLMDHTIFWPPENDPFTPDEIRRDSLIQENTLRTRYHRVNLTPMYRLVDEEVTPGMPRPVFLGLRPAFVNVTFPIRWDLELKGPGDGALVVQDTLSISADGKSIVTDTRTLAPGTVRSYSNVYAGTEIWTKWIQNTARPMTFIFMAGVYYENFYDVKMDRFLGTTRLYLGF
ncbi:MAG: hypothetical protein JWP91_2288 [Fibrobacteres bacterium]|nr:hypothetical protein [Fibrobacterota bacterium]